MKKSVFIATSYNHRTAIENILMSIKKIVNEFGFEPIVFVNSYEQEGVNYKKMQNDAFLHIDQSVVVIAELSHKAIGVGIEMGYAKARNKPIIYLHNDASEISTTTLGIAEDEIVYRDQEDLETKLRKSLQYLFSERI